MLHEVLHSIIWNSQQNLHCSKNGVDHF